MKKRYIVILVLVVLVIFGGTFSWDFVRSLLTKRFIEHYRPPAVTVSASKATLQTWHPQLYSVGTLKAVNGVNVSPELSGQIVKIYFDSGQIVKKSDPLIQLDNQINLQQLRTDTAQFKLNELTYQRQLELYQTHATPKSSLDEASAKLVQSQAAVAQDQVTIDKKLIKAPFAGKLGIRDVDLGQYVQPGDKLVPLQQMDPLHCDFSLAKQNLKYLKVGMSVNLSIEAYPLKIFSGTVTGINSLVDINTRTITVRATIPNKDNELYPGVYANVAVLLPEQLNVVTVPQTAVTYSLYGDTVYVISDKGTDKKGNPIQVVNQRYITVGERRGNYASITKGLKAGELVVTAGQLKLQNGTTVKINNSVKID